MRCFSTLCRRQKLRSGTGTHARRGGRRSSKRERRREGKKKTDSFFFLQTHLLSLFLLAHENRNLPPQRARPGPRQGLRVPNPEGLGLLRVQRRADGQEVRVSFFSSSKSFFLFPLRHPSSAAALSPSLPFPAPPPPSASKQGLLRPPRRLHVRRRVRQAE